MNKISIALLAGLVGLSAHAQSQGYDPENPPDPSLKYELKIEAAPRYGGTVNNMGRNYYEPGSRIDLSAYANQNFVFRCWMAGDSVLSTDTYHRYTMPEHNEVVTAYFDPAEYNPSNPGDPFDQGYTHKVSIYASPSVGGFFNNSNFLLLEGGTDYIYAYPYEGFRFSAWKQGGEIISTDNPLKLTMGQSNVEITASFVYDPSNPSNPGSNSFDEYSGCLIMDDFEPGSLYSAMARVLDSYSNFEKVLSLIVCGNLASSDFGFSNDIPNCELFDLARTSGLDAIPSWSFNGMAQLQKVILPSTVTCIRQYAFSSCPNLSELCLYASVPPEMSYGVLEGSSEGLVIRVPSSAIELYKKADGWKNYQILPLDEEMCSIEVALPADAADGRYKNMTLELKSQTSGQTISRVITDRTSYVFSGLVPDSRYNLNVKSKTGAVLGSISDIDVARDNVKVAFESLLQPCSVSLIVKTPSGEDVTDMTAITWTDSEGRYLARGSVLEGMLENETVSYTVAVSEKLAADYQTPAQTTTTISSTACDFECVLTPYETAQLSGTVLNGVTGQPLPGATVTATQQLEGSQMRTFAAITDSKGAYTLTVFRRPTQVNVAFGGYVSQNVDCNIADAVITLDAMTMRRATGYEVTLDATFTPAVGKGQTAETQSWFADNDKTTFSLRDKTTGRQITNISLQYPQIVILDPVENGHEIEVTASSRNNSFDTVTGTFTSVETGKSTVSLPIVERGSFAATYSMSEAGSVAALVYDAEGNLTKKGSFANGTFDSGYLPQGSYTLVAMASSQFFNSIGSLDELANAGFRPDVDYVSATAQIRAGIVDSLAIALVPKFDESRFYFTGPTTLFSANKPSVTVGNYITLKAKIDFRPEYAEQVSNVKISFEIPAGCSVVENSVMTGASLSSYAQNGNNIIVEVPGRSELVKFCVIPTEGGVYEPTAKAIFNLDGREVEQPLGSARFSADNMKIFVPDKTPSTNVVVRGTTVPLSKVQVYDGDVMVGNCMAQQNGRWKTNIDLYKPFAKSVHLIHAVINSPEGKTYVTDSKYLDYDSRYAALVDIKMVYNGLSITFDPATATTSTNTYSYVPGYDKFTFVAAFEGDAKGLSNVRFKVLATDGKSREHEAIYDEKLNSWAATAIYDKSFSIPANVTVLYDENVSEPYDRTEALDDQKAILEQCYDAIKKGVDDKVNMELTEDAESYASLDCTVDGLDAKYRFTIREIPFAEAEAMMKEVQFMPLDINGELVGINVEYGDAGIRLTAISIDEKFAMTMEITDPAAVADKQRAGKFDLKVALAALKASTTNGKFIIHLGEVGSGILDLFGIGTYLSCYSDFQSMFISLDVFSRHSLENIQKLNKMVLAKCADGTYRLTKEQMLAFDKRIQALSSFVSLVEQDGYEYLEEYKRTLLYKMGYDLATMFAGKAVDKLAKSSKFQNNKAVKKVSEWFSSDVSKEAAGDMWATILGYSFTAVTGGLEYLVDLGDFNKVRDEFNSWFPEKSKKAIEAYVDIWYDIRRAYKYCKPQDDDNDFDDPDPNYPTPPLSPSIDPSGFVYEAVVSNRLEGVTATALYKELVEDMYGDIHENVVVWNAEEYAQKNPLFTDENGMYAWDVPQGMWQVKFEKEGYETTFSEWLPVPPPQLDVNIGMKQMRQPEVAVVHAYADAVTIDFDKYMLPSTLTTDNIIVTVAGKPVEGSIELLDEESGYGDDARSFASKIRFKASAPFEAKEVTLSVANRVHSYAGVRMDEAFVQTFDVEPELTVIDVPESMEVVYGEQESLDIRLLSVEAAAGKTLVVETSADMIVTTDANRYTADKDGKVTVAINGELPGSAVLTFTVEGYDLTKSITVDVLRQRASNMVSMPTASVESGSVATGTEVFLYCATENATIYYTLDGSCPCDAGRLTYTGQPIVLTADTTLKLQAEADGMEQSEVAVYEYVIDDSGIARVEFEEIDDQPCYDLHGLPVDPATYRGVIVSKGRKVIVK